MKKNYLLIIVLALTLLLASCSGKKKLVLYLPNDYILDDVIIEFEKEHNVRVNKRTFNNNEMALGFVKTKSYDLVIPSDYAIEELAVEGYLMEIDYNEILDADVEFAEGLDLFLDQLDEEGFNFRNYAVPYFWGSVGILYKHDNVSLEQMEKEGYNILADPKLETIIYDSPRDAVMAGLLTNDVLLNDATQADINKSRDWLVNAFNQKTTSRKSDEILDELLAKSRYDAVMAYSGDAAYIMSENEDYSFYIPHDTNLWADGFVIPTNAKEPDLAKDFIRHMLTYDIALDNTIEIGYSAARKDVFEEMISEDGDYGEDRLRNAYESKILDFQLFRFDNRLKLLVDKTWENALAAQ